MAGDRKEGQGDRFYSRGQCGDPYRALVVSIVLQAAKDYQAGDLEAKTWLLESAPDWLETCGVGIAPRFWLEWVKAGCPEKLKRGRQPRVKVADNGKKALKEPFEAAKGPIC